MTDDQLIDLRDALQKHMLANGTGDAATIAASFVQKQADLIAASSKALCAWAIRRMVDGVGRRRARPIDTRQGDLFPTFRYPTSIVFTAVVDGKKKLQRGGFETSTVSEARASQLRAPRSRERREDKRVAATLDRVGPYVTDPDTMTMAQAMAATEAAEARRREEGGR